MKIFAANQRFCRDRFSPAFVLVLDVVDCGSHSALAISLYNYQLQYLKSENDDTLGLPQRVSEVLNSPWQRSVRSYKRLRRRKIEYRVTQILFSYEMVTFIRKSSTILP